MINIKNDCGSAAAAAVYLMATEKYINNYGCGLENEGTIILEAMGEANSPII